MKIVGNKKHIKWENYDRYKVKYLEEDVPTFLFSNLITNCSKNVG